MGWRKKLKEKIAIKNELARQALAECLGTFILVAFGDGAVAQHVLGNMNGAPVFHDFHSVSAGWGFAVALGVWVSGGVSGGHINPAVTGALVVVGKCSIWKFPIYMLAQYLGAFLASACLYGVYYDALESACNHWRNTTGPCATAGIWATYPQSFLSTGVGFADQFFSTALIMCCIMAIVDDNNMKPPKGMIPFCIGLIFYTIGLAFGFNAGFAVNPARDLGPRIFTAMVGYGQEPFLAYNYWFWVPVIAAHTGMICGAIVYSAMVGAHIDDTTTGKTDEPEVTKGGQVEEFTEIRKVAAEIDELDSQPEALRRQALRKDAGFRNGSSDTTDPLNCTRPVYNYNHRYPIGSHLYPDYHHQNHSPYHLQNAHLYPGGPIQYYEHQSTRPEAVRDSSRYAVLDPPLAHCSTQTSDEQRPSQKYYRRSHNGSENEDVDSVTHI